MKSTSALSIAICFLTCPLLYGATAGLQGKITGSNGTVIGDARVTIRNGTVERTAISDSAGNYQFADLDPALTYSLQVEAEGLHSFSKSNVLVDDGQTRVLDVVLQLEDVHTSVLVRDGVINLEAGSAEVSQTIDSTEVNDLPVANRTATKYALLDPHVRQTIGLGSDYQDANRLSINAGSYRHTSYMLDGTTNYDWVYAVTPQANISPASIDGVKLLSGDYSAQYGNSTNGIISITTPTGTDKFHGDLFSYVRPSGLQAMPELATSHIPDQRLDWGAKLGGPLVSDRTYFFASYERMQQDRGAVMTVPNPTFFDGRTNQYSGLLRIDDTLTKNNTMTARFNGDHYATNNANDRVSGGNQPSFGRIARVQSWGGQVSEQAVVGNMVNVARFAYTNYFPDSATPLDPSVGISIDHYTGRGSPQFQAGYSTFNWVHAQTETAGDMVALRDGRNSWKFGGEFVNLHVKDYSFTPFGTYFYKTVNDFNNSNPYKFTQTFGVADLRYGQKEMSAFVQDDLKLSSRLTANLGLRYEFQSITDSLHNLGPRVGLAWDVTGRGKTVVRAGSGIFFDQYYMYVTRRFTTFGPDTPQKLYTWDCTSPSVTCPTYPNSVSDTSGLSLSRAANYLYVPADKLLNPYSIQFSASVEHQLSRDVLVSLSGLETHTLQQMRVNDINHPAPYSRAIGTPARSTSDANSTRPFTTYDGVNVTLVDRIENSASSVYQAFDASIKDRFSRWGEVSGHYVFSASSATAMFYADYNSGVPSEWWSDWNALERGPSDFYQRQRFIADAVLHGPYSTTLSIVGTFGSGLPVNPLTGQDDNGDGYKSDRPVGFARNSFRTPPQKAVDVALAKQFVLHERLRAEVRAETLNIFNSKNFINVNNTYGEGAPPSLSFLSPLPGITNTDPSRQLQFAVRFLF